MRKPVDGCCRGLAYYNQPEGPAQGAPCGQVPSAPAQCPAAAAVQLSARRLIASRDCHVIISKLAVAVAQLVESRIVIPVVVGSSPISHPIQYLGISSPSHGRHFH